MERVLYSKLTHYNETVENGYRQQWGSAMAFMDAAHMYNGAKQDEVALVASVDRRVAELERQRLENVLHAGKHKYTKKYGVTRAHLIDGRPVPRSKNEELRYTTMDRKLIETQHRVRLVTDKQGMIKDKMQQLQGQRPDEA